MHNYDIIHILKVSKYKDMLDEDLKTLQQHLVDEKVSMMHEGNIYIYIYVYIWSSEGGIPHAPRGKIFCLGWEK